MTTLKQAAEQALEALEKVHGDPKSWWNLLAEITALRQAIALEKMAENERELGIQMVTDEPVAWMRHDGKRVVTAEDRKHYPTYEIRYVVPLYTSPQPAIPAPPEAQTEAETLAYAFGWFKALEHARQTADEPVARVTGYYAGRCVIEPLDRAMVMPDNMALYAHPQPKREWVKLTDEEIRQMCGSVSVMKEVVREAETKLKEKNT